MLPQVEVLKDYGYEVLYLTEYLDEFVIKILNSYKDKKFVNVTDKSLDLDTEEEKKAISKVNDDNKEMLDFIKDTLKDYVKDVKFTNKLKNHPVCLSSTGDLSLEMEHIINTMPNQEEKVKAETILEINDSHNVSKKMRELFKENNTDELATYAKILYNQARLISGLPVDNPNELTDLICSIISK